ncbi:hypothetical protein TNCV_1300611, partial [Trichonephila clavipes]
NGDKAMRILVAQLGEVKSNAIRAPYGYQTNLMTLIDDTRLRMPLRRNRRQYEQLTDFDVGPYNRPQRVGRIDVSAATSVGAIW